MFTGRIDLKRVGKYFFWFALTALALNLGVSAYKILKPFKVRAASGAPYTVLRTETGFDKAGIPRYTNHYLEAIRTDGSTMKRVTTSVVQQRTIYFASGDEVLANELLGRKSTYPKRYSGVPLAREPQASCQNASDMKTGWVAHGVDVVGGYRTVRYVLPGPKRTLTAWYAPDAGCALLQLRLQHEDGVTVQNLTSIILGEPDVPDTLQEVPPSSLYEPICSGAASSTCSSVPESVKQRLDKNYYAVRVKTQ